MPSKHAGESLGVRAPKEVRAAALAVLRGRDVELQAFVVACLKAVTTNPDGILKALDKYWPDPPTKGVKKNAPGKPSR